MCFFRVCQYLVVASLFTLSASICAAQDPTNGNRASYLTIQVPGALGTYPMALNNAMVVTGYYLVSPTKARAFIQDAEGAITTFSLPDSVWTEPVGINAAGDITGYFEVVVGVAQEAYPNPEGFLRYADGRVVTFSFPNHESEPPLAVPAAINDFDEIAGNYRFPFEASNGFTLSRAGVMERISYADGGDYPTVVTGLNGSGTVIGIIWSGDGDTGIPNYRSLIMHPDGNYNEEVDFPVTVPAGYLLAQENTTAAGINAQGAIAGWYQAEICLKPCDQGVSYSMMSGGFIRSPRGNFTAFQAPGPIVISQPAEYYALPNSIVLNGNGTTAGSYTDANMAQHGFVRDPLGKVTSFDPPRGRQTTATSINDSGVIAGSFYHDWNAQIAVGFLRLPMP